MSIAKVGKPAPDFTASVYDPATPNDYKGSWLVFFWYPMDFTFVCPTEITAFSNRISEFEEIGAKVLGASADSIYSHKAWANTPLSKNGIEGLSYPVLSDKTLTISAEYGVLIEEAGVALRGLFIIDPNGVLQYSVVNNLNIGRSVDETLRVLQALQTGGLCPSDWKPGQKTLA
jgi:peroxiredoxin (alkyl hydroperoxide reductase subunit C)